MSNLSLSVEESHPTFSTGLLREGLVVHVGIGRRQLSVTAHLILSAYHRNSAFLCKPGCHAKGLSDQLFVPRVDLCCDLFGFTGCLPESEVIHQLINMAVKPLLTLLCAPDLDALLNKPL